MTWMKSLSRMALVLSAASAIEPADQDDCPNSEWSFVADAAGNYCEPNGVVIECDARQMIVTMKQEHIFKSLDKTMVDKSASSAIVGPIGEGCSFVSKNNGAYNFNFKLDKCGTQVAQSNGEITFTNTITGNVDALTIQGIIMTKLLTLDVQCTYSDTFDLEIDPIYLNTNDIDIDGINENGDFKQYFGIHAYKDSTHSSEIASDNTVYIGDRVWVKIAATKNLPSTIDYYLTDCMAYKDYSNKATTSTYSMIEGMCYADLIDINNNDAAVGGAGLGRIKFDFDAFAFSNHPTHFSMQCTIKLCVLSVDGDKVDSTCALQPQADACPAGYSLD